MEMEILAMVKVGLGYGLRWGCVGLGWGSAISEQKIKQERRSSALLSLTIF